MFKNKKLLYIIIAIVVIAIIILAVAKKKGSLGKQEGTKVSVEVVQKRTIVELVSANGKISPETEVKLSPDVSGEIIELLVKEGDQVKAGQLLAKINPEIYVSSYERSVAGLNTSKANYANAKAQLAQVKAQFLNAKTSFERNKTLFEQKAISQADFDNAQTQFAVAQSNVESSEESVKAAEFSVNSAEATVKESRENLSKTSIYAPVSGTISKLNIEKGERVAGASQFSSGTEILRIANLQLMEVNVSVNENDIVRVHVGDTAIVEVDAYQNRKFKGYVSEISTSANTVGLSADQVTNFDIKIRILSSSYRELLDPKRPEVSPFRPGMSATVDIQTKTAVDVLTVPIQSVTTRIDEAKKAENADKKPKTEPSSSTTNEQKKKPAEEVVMYVFVLDGSKAKMTKVKTGIQDNNYIQITEGLKEKDEVISAPYRAISKTLKDGDLVKKVDAKELYKVEK